MQTEQKYDTVPVKAETDIVVSAESCTLPTADRTAATEDVAEI